MGIRERLVDSLAGKTIEKPVFATYDWFVNNRNIDWDRMFELGLGQINHANLIHVKMPNVNILREETEQNGHTRIDTHWITDIGELHEWRLGQWRQSYPIKSSEDYKIMLRAFSDLEICGTDENFDQSESELGDKGITLGQFGDIPPQSRTPFQRLQIDYVGIEKFFMDLIDGIPALFELLELMNDQLYKMFKCTLSSKAEYIKLWENMSLEFMGPDNYRKYLMPVYKTILNVVQGYDKKIIVHYDGKLSLIAEDLKVIAFDGLDSLTPPPEGDMTIKRARDVWPDKFFWINPCLGWYHLPQEALVKNIIETARQAGPTRYCMMISEEVPHNWEENIPAVLKTLGD